MAKLCPFLKKDCAEHACHLYINLLGTNPQDGSVENKWGCSFAFLPILIIENSKMQRETGAAIESMRNETVMNADKIRAGFAAMASVASAGMDARLIGGSTAAPEGGT